MYEVFHTDRPDGPAALSNFYRTLEEAQEAIANTSGGRRDPDTGLPVQLRGEDFLSVREVERETKPCRFCGGEVQSTSEDCDFCRSCFYQGRTYEDGVKAITDALKSHDRINPGTVGVWHTGGGCFCVGATVTMSDGTLVDVLTSHEASVDDLPSHDTPWGMSLCDSDGEGFYVNGAQDNLITPMDFLVEVDELVARWERGERDQ